MSPGGADGKSGGGSVFLTGEELNTACAILVQCVERLFDDAATKLNLKSLMGFMSELSFYSHKQLLTIYPKRTVSSSTKLGKKRKELRHHGSSGRAAESSAAATTAATQASCSTLLFHRISEVMLKCVRSGRPLLHIVKAWSVVGTHLMEVGVLRGGRGGRRKANLTTKLLEP